MKKWRWRSAHGASLAGGRAIVCMKHVGLNVAADPFMTISYTGVKGGFVIVVADDPGQHSSQNEQDSRHWTRFGKVPMLEPADSQECRISRGSPSTSAKGSTRRCLSGAKPGFPTATRLSNWERERNRRFQKGSTGRTLPKMVMVPMYARVRRSLRGGTDRQAGLLCRRGIPLQHHGDQRSFHRIHFLGRYLPLYERSIPAVFFPEARHGVASAQEADCGVFQKSQKGDCRRRTRSVSSKRKSGRWDSRCGTAKT